MARVHYREPHFYYAPSVKLSEAKCPMCSYSPDRTVDNPAKCLSDHTRRVHREFWIRERRRTYVIQEYP